MRVWCYQVCGFNFTIIDWGKTKGLWGGEVVCMLVCVLLHCVGLSSDCLCVYQCNMIVGVFMFRSSWMCIGYMLGTYLV